MKHLLLATLILSTSSAALAQDDPDLDVVTGVAMRAWFGVRATLENDTPFRSRPNPMSLPEVNSAGVRNAKSVVTRRKLPTAGVPPLLSMKV